MTSKSQTNNSRNAIKEVIEDETKTITTSMIKSLFQEMLRSKKVS